MPRRCTLISPTNLMFEQPILSPVDESEFLLFGMKEFRRLANGIRAEFFSFGLTVGFVFAALVVFAAKMWAPR